MTDGPNGARGATLPGRRARPGRRACPCGSALGATWDPELVERVGAVLGDEARTKACRVLLAPTVNIHRSPLAGRNFECYSEDPLLAGQIAAAFVRGVQSQGVAHDGQALRRQRRRVRAHHDQLGRSTSARCARSTCVPFELAVREGGALGIMTAYNRLNGAVLRRARRAARRHPARRVGLRGLRDHRLVRARARPVGSARAGLDLEMPGPGPRLRAGARRGGARRRGRRGRCVDAAARRLLTVFDRIGALDDPRRRRAEQSIDRPRTPRARARGRGGRRWCCCERRRAAARPADGPRARGDRPERRPGPDHGRRLGERRARTTASTPLDALRERLGDVDDRRAWLRRDGLSDIERTARRPSAAGFDVEYFVGPDLGAATSVHRRRCRDGRAALVRSPAPGVAEPAASRSRATRPLHADETGPHTFTLVQIGRRPGARRRRGRARRRDRPAAAGRPSSSASAATRSSAESSSTAGRAVELVVEYSSAAPAVARGRAGRAAASRRRTTCIDRAVAAAAGADVAVVVVGTNDDWETEGHDRDVDASSPATRTS